jgi:hypothetical protein
MEREKLKNILLKHYSFDMVKSIMCGRQKPSYPKMLQLSREGIPFEAWTNIKSFVKQNTTKPKISGQVLRGVRMRAEGNAKEQGDENSNE